MVRLQKIKKVWFWSLCTLSSAAMEQDMVPVTSDINAQDENGDTTLHKQINTIGKEKEHLESVRLLIAKGADVRIANNKGNTPVHCAVKVMFKPVVNSVEGKMLLQLLYTPSGSIVQTARERAFCLLCCFTRYNNSVKNSSLKIPKDLRKFMWKHVMIHQIKLDQLAVLQHVLQNTNKNGFTPLQLAKMYLQKMHDKFVQLAQQYPQAEGLDKSIKEVGEGLQDLLDPEQVAQHKRVIVHEATNFVNKMLLPQSKTE